MKLRKSVRRASSRNEQRQSFFGPKRALPHRRRLNIESLEARNLLATLYVDNQNDFIETTNGGGTPLVVDNGDTVTFNPMGGTQMSQAGLIYGTTAFGTIQEAVDAAMPGDTINVAQGTFPERVDINKPLILRGNQFGVAGQNVGRTGLATTETVVTGSGNNGETPFNLQVSGIALDGFTVEGNTNNNVFGYGILLAQGTGASQVRNNIVQNNITGLGLSSSSTTLPTVIERNLFRNNNNPGSVSGAGIYSDQTLSGGNLTNVIINDNVFTGNDNAGVLLGSTLANSQSNITVSNNTFTGNANAVVFFNTSNSTITRNNLDGQIFSQLAILDGSTGIQVTENFIENGGSSGIRIADFGGGPVSNVTINNNSIENNAGPGLNLSAGAYTGVLNAESNWWGSPTGPTTPENPGGTGDEIVAPPGQVDFTPFLPNGTDSQPGTPGFQPTGLATGMTVVGTGLDDILIVNATSDNDGTYQLTTNGVPGPVVPFMDVTSFSFAALAGNDLFIINNPGTGLFAPVNGIFYDGGGQPGDALSNRGGRADFGSYTPGPTVADGVVTHTFGSLVQTITFTGLAPVDDTVIEPDFTINGTAGADNITISNGPIVAGVQTISVASPTFETMNFGNKINVDINGQGGADTFTLDVTTNATGLATLDLYGHNSTAAGDDSASDTFNLNASPAAVSVLAAGQGGTDYFNNLVGDFNLDTLLGPLTIDGGESTDDADIARLQDSADPGPDTVTFDRTSPTVGTIAGATANTITYTNLEGLLFESTAASDTINVLATLAGTSYYITGNGGGDTVTIGNTAAGFATPGSGSLDNINGEILVTGEFNPAVSAVDTLNVDDSGTVAPNNATIGINPAFNFTLPAPSPGGTDSGPATELIGFAPAPIRYRHGDSSFLFAGTNAIEFVNIRSGQGADTIAVNATTATNTTTLDAREGNDAVTINGDNLSAANVFNGFSGNDAFTLNVSANLGATAFRPLTSLQINGQDPALSSANRDTLTVNDNLGPAEARNLTFDYQDGASGDINITGYAVTVDVNTTETVFYNGAGGDDNVTVRGTSGDDDLTVFPFENDSALVFLGGDPWDGPSEGGTEAGFLDNLPGVAGGSRGPDLRLNNLAPLTGLTVNGDGAGAAGDQLYVYGTSEDSIVDPAAAGTNIFGFGNGIVIPSAAVLGFATAYDRIRLTDSQITIQNDYGSAGNNLLRVNVATGSFVQTAPDLTSAIILNSGFEAAPGVPDPLCILAADEVTIVPSAILSLTANGGDPDGSNLPQGDELIFEGPFSEVNVFSDKAMPPMVGFTFDTTAGPGGDTLPVTTTSFECIAPIESATVILVGDNNDPAVDENDTFVVVGQDVDSASGGDADGANEFVLVINGSGPIGFTGVEFLNVYGDDQNPAPGTPSVANDIDTLDVTPYADNADDDGHPPRGWGIDVFFDEGNPVGTDGEPDFLIVRTSNSENGSGSVSEDIVIVPSGPDNGEVRVTNAADGSVIVIIQYVNNTDIEVIDDDGSLSDTDSLTLRGTNPDNTETSGDELFDVNFTNPGTPLLPIITVEDSGAGLTLYRVRNITGFDTLTIDALGGNDDISVQGRTNGTSVAMDGLVVLGGAGNDTLIMDNSSGLSDFSAGTTFHGGTGLDSLILLGTTTVDSAVYTPGPNPDEGTVTHTINTPLTVQTIHFTGLEPILDVVPAASLTINATNGDNAINYSADEFGLFGRVSVDNFEPYEFSDKVTLIINALAGNDTINLNNPILPAGLTGDADGIAANGIQPILVNAGDPADNDRLIVNGLVGNQDNFLYSPSGIGGGEIDNTSGAPSADVAFTGVEAITVSAQAADLDVFRIRNTPGNDTVEFTPAADPFSAMITGFRANPAGFTFVPVKITGIAGFYELPDGAPGGVDTLIVNGTSADDIFRASDSANFPGFFSVNVNNNGTEIFPDATSTSLVILRGLEGNDTFNVDFNPLSPPASLRPIRIEGGDSDSTSDVINYTATPGAEVTINLITSTITQAGPVASPVTFSGAETLNIIGADGSAEEFNVIGYGSPSSLNRLNLNGGDTNNNDNDSINLTLTNARDTLHYFPHDRRSARLTREEGGPEINVAGFNDAEGSLSASGLASADRLVFHGSALQDLITARVFTPGSSQTLITMVSGFDTLDAENTVPIDIDTVGGNTEAVTILGDAGNDRLDVNNSNGLVLVDSGIVYDGGTGSDTLRLLGTTAVTTVTYNVGPQPDTGTVLHTLAGTGTQQVRFANLEPVIDTVTAASLVINATNASNAINYILGANSGTAIVGGATTGQVSIDSFETFEFANKTALTINALAGSDTISLNNTTTPAALTSITVNGSDPTALSDPNGSDTLIVNGTTGLNAIDVTHVDSDSLTVAGAGPVTVAGNAIEHLVVNGQGGSDALTIITPAGEDAHTLTPGSQPDQGLIESRALGLGTAYVPVRYEKLGAAGSVSFEDATGSRSDRLEVYGTETDDRFTVGPGDAVQVFRPNQPGGIFRTVAIVATDINHLTLHGLGGDDRFEIAGPQSYASIVVHGGGPGASDVLDFDANGTAPVSMTLNDIPGQVSILGGGVTLLDATGIEVADVDAGGQSVLLLTRTFNEIVTVKPTTVDSATVMSDLGGPVIDFDSVSTLTVSALGGNDTLRVRYRAEAETINVDGDSVDVSAGGPLLTVNHTLFNALEVYGEQGNDTFNVTPAAIPIFIDGGDPIGVMPGDRLNVIGAIGFAAGPENDEGGFLTLLETVSFDHIESLSVVGMPPGPGGPGFLILGTNGDDDITVIARDSSTHVGADGVQDFTISVNAGPELLFLNQPNLFIDALSGDDDIVVRAPAPNDADWNVNVRVAGGPPSIGEPNDGDRLVLETPGADTLIFTPTGPDTGILLIEEGGVVGTFDSTDSQILFGPFTFTVDVPVGTPIEFTYVSSPGGVELVEYDGERAGTATVDAIIINGTGLNDTTTANLASGPGGVNSGTFVSAGSPLFNFRSFTDLTTNAGAGGFDHTIINGTQGPDTITSDADTVLLTGMTVTLSAAIDRLDINTFGGNDTIDLDLVELDPTFVRAKRIDAGDGDDTVDLSGSVDADIFGGIGNDTLIGSPATDNIFGGAGNDIIIGGGGVDFEYGEDGNDRFGDLTNAGNGIADDADADFMFGGDGIDQFIWEPGDGNDVIQGGVDGADILRFFGNSLANTFTLNPALAAGTHFNISFGMAATVDTHGVEEIIVDGGAGADTFVVADLTPTEIEDVIIVMGAGSDSITVNGRTVSDEIAVTVTGTRVNIAGLDYDVNIDGAVLADSDSLVVNSNGGNDTITVASDLSALYAVQNVTSNGGTGDDFLSGYGTLSGDAGNDTLVGDDSSQLLLGGDGNDQIFGGAGDDLIIADGSLGLIGLGVGNTLVQFAPGAPGTVTGTTPVTGLLVGENIVALDVRPANSQLYALTNLGRLVTIDPATGAITSDIPLVADPTDVTAPFTGIVGTAFGFDFNPAADRLRIVSDADQNLRINVANGFVTTDSTLNPGNPNVVGSAYTNSSAGATSTTLYSIDSTTDQLFRQDPPNNGTQVLVGPLGVDTSDVVGFDIVPGTNVAYASLTVGGMAQLFTINLATGAATPVGAIGAGGPILGLAAIVVSGTVGGEDTIVGGLGNDTIDGGPQFDTILVQATSGNDRIDLIQNSPTLLRYEISNTALGFDGIVGGTGTETDALIVGAALPTVEEVRIVAGSGDDLIRVTQSDSLIALGQQAFSLRVTVDGGAPGASDRLSVTDDGLGDTTIQRIGGTPGEGSFAIGALAPVVYTGVEFASLNPVDSISGGTGSDGLGRLFVFKYDPYEQNQTRLSATHLGANSAINTDPTIDPGPDALFGLPGDHDWYRVVAQFTGTLDFTAYFRQQGPLLNGRAGLPGAGDLQLEAYDLEGNLIVGFGANESVITDTDERIRIPVVEGQTYFFRVRGEGDAVNVYNVTSINTPAPKPFDLELDDVVGVGRVIAGAGPNQFSAVGEAPFALSPTSGFYVGKDIVFTGGNLNGLRGRVVTYTAPGTFTFANFTFPAAASPGSTFQIESADTGRSQFDNITRDTTPTIFIRVPDAALLGDIPDNGAAFGLPPDLTPVIIPHVTDVSTDVPTAATPRAGFRVAVFVTETNTQAPVLAGYAQPVAGSPGTYSFTFTTPLPVSIGTSNTTSFFISSRVEMIDPASLTNPADPVTGTDPDEQAQGFGAFSQSFEIVVDTQPPPVFFGTPGDPDDGLAPGSDTGFNTNPETLDDGITNDTTPRFFGQAEANAVIRLFADVNNDGMFQPTTDIQIAATVALPFDGTNQYPNGFWEATSTVDLNADPFPTDGLRRIFVTAEDVAGNINPNGGPGQVISLEIFIDTQGPQIIDVEVGDDPDTAFDETGYDLFDPKPSSDGPTPLVNSIILSLQDLPDRTLDFLLPAIKADIAGHAGHYRVTGDFNGNIPILAINVDAPIPAAGGPAVGTIEIVFRTRGADNVFNTSDDVGSPLPDDRFTLFVSDEGIFDPVGNALDGESNASEPHNQGGVPPIFGVDGVPTGDGLPGGDFVARFTVDSRPEVGVFAAGSAWIDTNGNNKFDPDNADFTNRDIAYTLGFASDDLFAGKFVSENIANDRNTLFDKIAAYGRVGTTKFRWLIDTDNDGVPDIEHNDPANINGTPVAGNFGSFPGDEVGLFTGTKWHFDKDHNFEVDASLNWPVPGYPIVGDFDGDGMDDLATWSDDVFSVDLSSVDNPDKGNKLPGGIDGTIDRTFTFGFIGPGERPVAADMNQDGIEDLGLWVPAREGLTPREGSEWYFLVSGVTGNDTRPNDPANIGPSITGGRFTDPANGPGNYKAPADYGLTSYSGGRIVTDPIGGQNIVRFQPVPFGNDVYAQFGDEFALPLIGNFDPPVSPAAPAGGSNTNLRDAHDVDNNGIVNAIDVLVLINRLNGAGPGAVQAQAFSGAPYYDVNADLNINALDVLGVINYLNATPAVAALPQGEGEGEGEPVDQFFAEYAADEEDIDSSEDLLALLAMDAVPKKKR